MPEKSGSQCVRSEQLAEIPFSQGWIEILHSHLDRGKIEDPRTALVTDRMGVEVRPFDGVECHLDKDRFPVKAFFLGCTDLAPQMSTSSPAERASSSNLERSMSSRLSLGDEASQNSQRKLDQVSTDLQFQDVWPGILQVKLNAVGVQGVNPLPGIFATDATGVEINLSSYDRMPDPSRFPLKLHFRAQGAIMRQNLEECFDRCQSQNSCEDKDKAHGKDVREHSTDLSYNSILSDVIHARMRDMGASALQKPCILVTDRIGVQVFLTEVVPDRSRFPLKFHLDDSPDRSSAMMNTAGRVTAGPTTRLREWGERKRTIFKRGLSKLSGN